MKKQTTKTDATAIAGSLLLAADLTFPANQFEPNIEYNPTGTLSADLSKLRTKLEKVENELSKCRTSTIEDGWQTQRHAKKSRKWDILAQEKMKLLQNIEDLEGQIEYMYLVEFSPREECPKCGETYDDADFDFQICSRCGFDNNNKA